MASHLHRTVAELRATIGYSEFLEWLQFFEYEKNHHTKLDWYLAQIASWVCKVNANNPNKVQVKDFLMVFQDVPSEAEKEQSVEDSKNIWAASLGIDLPKK